MSTNFPGNYDSYVPKVAGNTITDVEWENVQDAVRALEIKVGKNQSTDGTSLDYKIRRFFYSGRTLWIYENTETVPVGWSVVSASDKLLAVKGGSVYTAGGASGGQWAITGWSHGHTSSLTGNTYHRHASAVWANYWMWAVYTDYSRTLDYQGSGAQATSGSPDVYGTHDGAWRPLASIGLIIRLN